MMAMLLLNIVLLFLVHYASPQLSVTKESDSSKAHMDGFDPVSTTLTEHVTLDADKTFRKYTTEVKFKEGARKQTYGRPGTDHFNSIREKYSTLQRRAGSLYLKDPLSVSSILFNSNSKNERQQSPVPVVLQETSKDGRYKSNSQMFDTAAKSARSKLKEIRSADFTNEIEGRNEVKIDSVFTLSDTSLEEKGESKTQVLQRFGDTENQTRRQQSSAKEADDKLVFLFTQTYKKFLFDSYEESKDVESQENTDPEVRSRMLGDLLLSESAFDKLAKAVLRNTKWILDADLSPSGIAEKFNVSNFFLGIRRRAAAKLANQKRVLGEDSGVDSKAIRKGKIERSLEEPIGSVKRLSSVEGREKRVPQTLSAKQNHAETTPAKGTILLAHRNNGVPVTLKIGPEVGDPFKFLQGILISNKVTLQVQRKPHSIEAAQESEMGGWTTRGLYVDLSDLNQRNSFLKTLKKFETDPS